MTKPVCEVSWNLGLWRGEHGRPREIKLAPTICIDSYRDGYNHAARAAAAERKERSR